MWRKRYLTDFWGISAVSHRLERYVGGTLKNWGVSQGSSRRFGGSRISVGPKFSDQYPEMTGDKHNQGGDADNNDAHKHPGVAGCGMWRKGDKSLLLHTWPRSNASLGFPLDQSSATTILKYS